MSLRLYILACALVVPGAGNAADAPPAPVSFAPGLLQATLGLAVVLALIWGAAKLARRFSPMGTTARSPIKLVATQALGQRERVVLIELGDQWLLLGVAPGQVSALHTGPKSTLPLSAPGILLIFQQIIVGVALGLAMQLAFAAVQLAGDMIGMQMGLSFAAFIDPQNSTQTPIVGSFLSLVLMLLLVAINGHLMILSALVDSFQAVPVATGFSGSAVHSDMWLRIANAGGQVFAAGLRIAFPVIGAMMLANLALGVVTRTAPQLNLFAVGFPITLVVGLGMLMLGLPYLMPILEAVLQSSLRLFTN